MPWALMKEEEEEIVMEHSLLISNVEITWWIEPGSIRCAQRNKSVNFCLAPEDREPLS